MPVIPLVTTVAVVAFFSCLALALRCHWRCADRRRETALKLKYAGSPWLRFIQAHEVAVGMTRAQVIDARGKPNGRTYRALKTKNVEVLRYGSGRYSFAIKLDDGKVVGWSGRA